MRADLRDADLSGADMRFTRLMGAVLVRAKLKDEDMRLTDLRGARHLISTI